MLVGCLSLTLGDLRDPSDIRRCLASIRATASACSCPQGGPARWVNDSRCACDHGVPAASCDAVIAWSPASGVFAVPGLNKYGFTTLLRDFFGHLARACAAGEHLLYGGFLADGLVAATATPRLFPESFFDLDELNVALRKQRGCERTQVLPQSCATAEQHLPNITRCDRKIDWGHAPLAKFLAKTLPLNFTPAVAAAPSSVAVPATYNAVHFNLDCDWLLYLERRNGTRNRFTKYHHSDHPRAMTNALCGGGDVHINALGTAMAHNYARATASVASELPWLVVTSIGKPGHSAAQWVLDGYLRALPNLTFFRSGTQSRYREINAAAELGLLLGARNFVGLYHSTFSKFAAQRLDQKSNGSVITLICRCTKCCVAGVPSSLIHTATTAGPLEPHKKNIRAGPNIEQNAHTSDAELQLRFATATKAIAGPSNTSQDSVLLPEAVLLCAPVQRDVSTSNDILKMALYTYNFGDYRREIERYRSWDDFHGQDSRGTQVGEVPSIVGLLRMRYVSFV